ncbi:MAG: hypothetical protein JWO60_797 [Frankiales bacterium]|nr:hypothetical protein [Frankiales bacterium]
MLLAHGGGAPEALTVGVPLLVVLGLVLVERSARRKARADNDHDDEGEP